MNYISFENQKIIDMIAQAQPKMNELRQQYIEKIRNEVQQSTIGKLQQQAEAEAAGLNSFLLQSSFQKFFFHRKITARKICT
jgi:hypothetical protein